MTEVTNESATDISIEDGDGSEEEEEEEEDEKTVVESVNSEELKEDNLITSPKTSDRRPDEPDNMELRRALHRAGIDSRHKP